MTIDHLDDERGRLEAERRAAVQEAAAAGLAGDSATADLARAKIRNLDLALERNRRDRDREASHAAAERQREQEIADAAAAARLPRQATKWRRELAELLATDLTHRARIARHYRELQRLRAEHQAALPPGRVDALKSFLHDAGADFDLNPLAGTELDHRVETLEQARDFYAALAEELRQSDLTGTLESDRAAVTEIRTVRERRQAALAPVRELSRLAGRALNRLNTLRTDHPTAPHQIAVVEQEYQRLAAERDRRAAELEAS